MQSVRVIHNIAKEYPDMIKVLIYKTPQYYIHDSQAVKRVGCVVPEDYEPTVTSINRTRTLIKDIILCNDFDFFFTFTFDPDKVDRFSYNACLFKVTRWIHHQKERSPDLRYLLVPEKHKSGAWHFHALISQYNGSLRDSKHKTVTGRPIYNITSYRAGYSTAVPIDDKYSVAHYVSKYITKDFIRKFNRRRFICSRNLKRPNKVVNSRILEISLPLSKQKVADLGDREIYSVIPNF